ncbi:MULTISPECIES: GntR family transcriptional regulator [Micrococcales]|uniref:GntR family transcriptional regulator n=1 Tax=Micrococcales TaxID=85006 RepID=UPI000AF6B7B6|nr:MULTISPECIES: GntR family transcriptional regulator [Micrococcales]
MARTASSASPVRPRSIDWEDVQATREFFALSTTNRVPPYAQLRRRLVEARHTGELESGTRIPPVRKLAAALGLASNTVAKAYKELEASGVVETKGRAGSYIRPKSTVENKALRLTRKYLTSLAEIGIYGDEAEAFLRRVLDEESL